MRSRPGRSVRSIVRPSGRNTRPDGCERPLAIGTTRTRAPVSLVRTNGFSTGTAVSGTGGGAGGLGRSCARVTAPSAAHSAAVSQPNRRFIVTSDAKTSFVPDFPSGIDHEAKLRPLIVLGDLIAFDGARETALWTQAQIGERHVLRRLRDAIDQRLAPL